MSDLGPRLREAADHYPAPATDLESVVGGAERKARRRRRSSGAVGAIVAIVLVGAPLVVLQQDEAPQPATPVWFAPVEVGPGSQTDPYGNGTWLTWSTSTKGESLALARERGGRSVVRLNESGTGGSPGGFDPGTNRVIYQQYSEGESDIFTFDLDTGRREEVAALNSDDWESQPRISSTYILYMRGQQNEAAQLLLLNRATGEVREIAQSRPRYTIFLGSVGERFATWARCRTVSNAPSVPNCTAHLYDAEDGSTDRIGTEGARNRYAPLVDEARGFVYFVESGGTCGTRVGVWRLPLGELDGQPTKIASLPAGVDTGWALSSSPTGIDGSSQILFSRWDCDTQSGDIYAVNSAT